MIDPSQVEDVFLKAIEKKSPDELSAFLDDVCKGNLELRRQVDLLLKARQKAPDFLMSATSAAQPSTKTQESHQERANTIIAERFKLLELIGEGGMGEVWVADQFKPIRRRVALKLIKPGMDSRSVLARFEAERQALALMDHPNIAKVLDAGASAEQRPYFVMELVKGTPITTFCDARKLTPRERLELFIPVCQAIQHAHTKGIIHRDIKPSNVLVALHDEKPIPKVIDFGVSKAIGQQLTENTIYTGLGTLVGTPTYMAPEQATFNQLDIDTRADVYALGVLLYELLAGSPPVEPERMKKAALDELLRVVREEEPPLPSQRLSTSESKASIAATRQSDPAKLSRLIRGELDWIVMKALEKDRNRRYETANSFAADVQRYLAGDQVHAAPPTMVYRFRKFARKHRAMLTTAGAFAMLLIAASLISGWLALQARTAEHYAENRRLDAQKSAEAAHRASEQALEQKFLADIRSLSLKIDLDLIECQNDQKTGLLRLANISENTQFVFSDGLSPLNRKALHHELWAEPWVDYEDRVEFRQLREFIGSAIIALGQDFASLLPPISHDGAAVTYWQWSSTKERLLTVGKDQTARLWDLPTAKLITVLSRSQEQVLLGAFSPDGKTVLTDSLDGVVRIWDAQNGAYRAETEPRPGRIKLTPTGSEVDRRNTAHALAEVVQISNQRFLTHKILLNTERTASSLSGPVELWDLSTGKWIARIDAEGQEVRKIKFLADGRWIASTRDATVIIATSSDGKEIASLPHPGFTECEAVAVSPAGNWLETSAENPHEESQTSTFRLHFWDTSNWRLHPVVTTAKGVGEFVSEDYLKGAIVIDSFGGQPHFIVKRGVETPLCEFDAYACQLHIDNDFGRVLASVFSNTGSTKVDLLDALTGKRLPPRIGDAFHPDVAKFSANGRYLLSPLGDTLMDLKANKSLFLDPEVEDMWLPVGKTGCVKIGPDSLKSLQINLVPFDSNLDQSRDLLQLWAQVAVCGELNEAGEFAKWSEAQWEKKRQELAAIPKPIKDFPFPGYVATDKLHWLRAEYNQATEEAEKNRLAEELRRRAERSGDQVEATRWKLEMERLTSKVESPSEQN